MKKLCFFLTFGLFAVPVWAQVKVILLRDTATYQITRTALDKKYAILTALFRAQPQGANRAMQTRQKQFGDFLKKQPNLPQKAFVLFLSEYYRPDGSTQWVLVDADRSQPDSVVAKAVATLQDFYATTPYPASGTVPFRISGAVMYGKSSPPPRTVRRGPGLINTLAAAEKTTRPDTVTMLAFNQLELTNVPEVVYRFPNLTELDLSKNQLHELPARLTAEIPTLKRLSLLNNAIPDDSVFIARNKHLISLNLQNNKLTRIPPAVRQNRRLESLWMGNNELQALDIKTLRRLPRLSDLNLYNASLTELPKSIGRLKHVKVLDLYYNKFTALPRQLGRMKRLEQLAVAYNDLHDLPTSLAKLRRLNILFAHHNRISQLPSDFQRLTNLRVLDLGYNWFSAAPNVLSTLPALEELDLNNNNLRELPPSLGALKQLKKLYLRSNPLSQGNIKAGPYTPIIEQLESNKTEVFY